MFNNKDASFEIAQSMEKVLVSNAIEKQTEGLNKLAQAMEHLNAAAEIFDDVGLLAQAEVATRLLESLAAKKSKSKANKSKSSAKSKSSKSTKQKSKRKSKNKADSATKGLDSKKMLDNLEHKGWVFNADDDLNYAEDDNFIHDDDCMCSECMGADDTNYSRHGGDCVCDSCMDCDDDVNDMKLGISSNYASSIGSPEYWRNLAKHYTQRNELKKAEEAMMKAIEAENIDKYDSDEAASDDSNFDFDTDEDAGYHTDRDSEDEYNFAIDDDFEDEIELAPRRHDAIPPPPSDEELKMPDVKPYHPSSRDWKDIEETARKTVPATPMGRRHRTIF